MGRSLLHTLRALLLGGRGAPPLLEDETVTTPMGTVIRQFCANPTAVLGLVIFLSIFVLTFGLSAVFPMDASYQDVTQQDVSPGFGMADFPTEMGRAPRDLSVGPIFSVGADRNGALHVWGKLTQRQREVPQGAGDIVQVSAGLDHMLALDSSGRVYTWGSIRFGLDQIPIEVTTQPIRQVAAGHQFSLAVSEGGELFFWGNGNLIELDGASLPQEIQHHVQSVAVNSSNVVVLLDDGSLRVLGRSAAPVAQLPQTQASVLQVAVSDQAAVALTEGGEVVAWGNELYGLLDVPPQIQGRTTAVSAGRFHFAALLDDGTLIAWGRDQFGQTDVPRALTTGAAPVTRVFSGYFLNYAIDQMGGIHPFGLKGYLMGTDGAGRDIFPRLLSGGRLTLTVGAVAVLLAVSIGVFVGGVAGFYGGWMDLVLMRLAEIVDAIPFLPLAMTLSVLLESRVHETQRLVLIMVILGALSWPGMARLTRGQILVEREKEFVLAARAVGIRELGILFRYIVPNVITPILISATLSYAASMLTESALSFLGFGVAEPNATWGNMLTDAQSSQVIAGSWWRWAFPAAALCLTAVSVNWIGDGLRDAINPHSSRQ